jgi:hypothetical protein
MKHFPTTLPVYAFDFADAGSRPAIDQALSRLARRGKLYRLGWGLYIYPHKNLLTGQMRMPTADAVARSFARKLGHRILPSRPYASNLLRLSTQVPAKNVYITDGRSRVVQIGPHTLYFHHVEPSTLAAGGRVTHILNALITDLGKPEFDRLRFGTGNRLHYPQKCLRMSHIRKTHLPVSGEQLQLVTICHRLTSFLLQSE